MTRNERNIIYIIVGMLVAFAAIFILIAYVPAHSFDWLFKSD